MEQPALTVGLETRQKFPKEERTTFQALMGVVFFSSSCLVFADVLAGSAVHGPRTGTRGALFVEKKKSFTKSRERRSGIRFGG